MLIEHIGRLAARLSESRQRRQGPLNLANWSLRNESGRLTIDGIPASDLVERYGSPLFVLNEDRLRADIAALHGAFTRAPAGSKIMYSYKTNSIPGILRLIHGEGLGAEVISPFELWLADHLAVPASDTCYNGVSKTRESLEWALERRLFSVNVDSLQELQWVAELAESAPRPAAIGLRLSVLPGAQFGLDIPSGEAMRAAEFISARQGLLDWKVLHFHATANAQRAADHVAHVRTALSFMAAVRQATGIDIPYLDIGGGFGVPTVHVLSRQEYMFSRLFGTQPTRPDTQRTQGIDACLEEIIEVVESYCEQNRFPVPRLIIEPGRVVTSRAQLLLSRVNEVKNRRRGLQFAMTDIGRHSVAYPCDYERHEIVVTDKLDQVQQALYHVVGRICTSADFLARNRLLPTLAPGDVIAVLDAGAYFSSYASNFAFPRPAVAVVSKGQARLLHAGESFEHIVAMDLR